MRDGILTQEQTAEFLEVSTKTLGQWRWRGKGPRFKKIGRKISYLIEDIEEFEKSQLRYHTSQPVSYAPNAVD